MNSTLSSFRRNLTLLLATFLTLATLRAGDFLQPVAALANFAEDLAEKTIDGQGFEDPGVGTPDSVHINSGSEMWSSIGSIKGELVFDLGQNVTLTKVYLWNYNAPGATDWGMKDIEVHVAPESDPAKARFTGIATANLKEGGEKAQVVDVKGTNVRLVRIRNTSNWGAGYAIGLAEARFETGDVAGNVPSVQIANVKAGDTVPFGSDFSLLATVSDADYNIAKVEFFDGSTKLGETNKAPFSVSLKTLAKGEHTLRVVATDQTGLVGFDTVTVMVKEVVPGIVIKIDDNRDIGKGTNQITYSSGWTLAQGNANDPRFLNNDHYSGTSGNYLEVKFFGVKIDVYATVASHHGKGYAVIDGGTRFDVDYKAPQRAEQKLVWSSPLLPNRLHTLRITVAGTGVVTADRFDVTQSEAPADDKAVVKRWDVGLDRFAVEMEDVGASVVDATKVTLSVDGVPVMAKVTKAGAVTSITYTPSAAFVPGSVHPFKVEAKDTRGTSIVSEATFTVPAPPFALTGLGGPRGQAGSWGVRQVWNAGRADAVATAVDIAKAAGGTGFQGRVLDVQAPVFNFNYTPSPSGSGLFPDRAPFPGEAQELPAADWVTIGRAKIRIPRDGDWTIGVHSDDGFALRFIGHPFASVAGNGLIDEDFPEYIQFAVGTADSSTRGVLKGVKAGDYAIELIHFQRNGGAFAEVYAAEGAFADDGDTGGWALIGAADGWVLVDDTAPAGPVTVKAVRVDGASLVLEFDSANPAASHVVFQSPDSLSADAAKWTPLAGASVSSLGGQRYQAKFALPASRVGFYRIGTGGN